MAQNCKILPNLVTLPAPPPHLHVLPHPNVRTFEPHIRNCSKQVPFQFHLRELWWVMGGSGWSQKQTVLSELNLLLLLPTYLLLPREFISHVTNWKGRILSTGFFSRECISGNIRTYTGLRWFRVFAFKIAELLGGCFWEIWQNILGYACQDDLSIWVFFSCQTSKQSQLSN